MEGGNTFELEASRERSLARVLRWTPLVIWFCAVIVLMAALALRHQFSFAALNRRDTQLTAALAQIMPGARGWTAVHALYSECRCSQRVFEHLSVSRRPAQLRELVLLVGEERDQVIASRLTARGLSVFSLAPEQLAARFGIEGAPTFALVDPSHNVRYLGGYTLQKQGPDIRDLAIVQEVRAGGEVADLPVFGCAVSRRLRAIFQPFALRR